MKRSVLIFLTRYRRWVALACWLLAVLLFLSQAAWNIMAERSAAQSRLQSEAGRVASRFTHLLGLYGELTAVSTDALVTGLMEDPRLYAVTVQVGDSLFSGQRRNAHWEAVPWDGEITENTVQGMSPLRREGQPVGTVEVYLARRLVQEGSDRGMQREIWRFVIKTLLLSVFLAALYWHWGDLERLRSLGRRLLRKRGEPERPEAGSRDVRPGDGPAGAGEVLPVDAVRGRHFQQANPASWRMTAALFRQTFAHAPMLMMRLYAEDELEGLCHLGRMLAAAAPCLGAARLEDSAREMLGALEDPGCEARALAVETCAADLEEVLRALSGAAVK